MKLNYIIYLLIAILLTLGVVVVSLWGIALMDSYVQESHPDTDLSHYVVADKAIYGIASYYDYQLNGVWYSLDHSTCATRIKEWRYRHIRVTNLDNDKSVVCRINDYGPSYEIFPERIVDLSSYAFSQIADTKQGLFPAKIELIN